MSIPIAPFEPGRFRSGDAGPLVLVVDDEHIIREVLKRFLRSHGFVALAARSGEEAVELFGCWHNQIALVLLDVRLPGMSGPETLQAMREADAAVRCCFMSGDLGEYTEEQIQATGALHLFRKPFALHKLADVLRGLTKQKE
jgi:CheY-like chemotaxis protein